MSLLIDGYNLIHAAGIVGRGVGPGGLQRARLALLNFLAESLPPERLSRTTVVFDAAGAPPGLPHQYNYRGIKVHFARDYDTADDLLEELIQDDHSPRRLTVVSSDHRVQRDAKRRRAEAIDSDVWFAQIVRSRRSGTLTSTAQIEKQRTNPPPLSDEEIKYWLEKFALAPTEPTEASDTPVSYGQKLIESLQETENPFPPGYGEDVLKEEMMEEPLTKRLPSPPRKNPNRKKK